MPAPAVTRWQVSATLGLLVAGALVTRLLALPLATTDSADPVSRTFSAWRWLEDPSLITHGVWGPLHTYLIAGALWLYPDPVVAPIALHVGIAAATPVPLYLFTRREFHGHAAALLVAGTWVLYPVASSNSLTPTSEGPFVLLLLVALLLVSLARRERGSLAPAFGAGLALTGAGMLRYEGWMLTPLLGVLLWRRPSALVAFLLAAALHPVFWMVGNAVEHGDPLYPISWASRWELEFMGVGETLSAREVARRVVFYPTMTLLGLTPVVAVLCVVGAALSLRARERSRVWLIPMLGLLLLFCAGAARGSLALKVKYTQTLGALLFPFAARAYRSLGADTWSAGRTLLAGILLASSVVAFWSPPFLDASRAVPLFRMPTVRPVPQMPDQAAAARISALVNASLDAPDDAYVSDFFGWQQSYWVAWMTRIHPDRIYVAPGAPNAMLELAHLESFVRAHPRGTLTLARGSRLERALRPDPTGPAGIGALRLTLREIGAIPLRSGEVLLYRYAPSAPGPSSRLQPTREPVAPGPSRRGP